MRASVKAGPLEAASGSVASGFTSVGELADGITPVQVPIVIVNGRDDGPVVYLHAGSHGQETIYSVETLRRLRTELDPAGPRGRRDRGSARQSACASIRDARRAPLCGARGRRVRRRHPQAVARRPKGSMTQRIVHLLWTQIVAQCRLCDRPACGRRARHRVHLHVPGRQTRCARHAGVGEALDMARAFGVTLVTTAPNPLTLAGACLDAGKPAFMIEMTKSRMLDEQTVAGALARDPQRARPSRHAGRNDRAAARFSVVPGVHPAMPTIRAERGGLIRFEVECGTFLRAGTVIARTRDLFGKRSRRSRCRPTATS